MAMTPREVVSRTVRFEGADRIPYALTEAYGSDFAHVGMAPSPNARPRSGVDEWGCLWANIGLSNLGQVKQLALADWADWERLPVPDIRDPRRWSGVRRTTSAPRAAPWDVPTGGSSRSGMATRPVPGTPRRPSRPCAGSSSG